MRAIDRNRYRTRKGDIATNVLGVCAPDMQFVYVLPGWEGSAADGRVLRDAISRRNGLNVPQGKIFTKLEIVIWYYLVHKHHLINLEFLDFQIVTI